MNRRRAYGGSAAYLFPPSYNLEIRVSESKSGKITWKTALNGPKMSFFQVSENEKKRIWFGDFGQSTSELCIGVLHGAGSKRGVLAREWRRDVAEVIFALKVESPRERILTLLVLPVNSHIPNPLQTSARAL